MGKEIVRKESPDHPEKRSRLWFHKDIVEVLEQNKGTSETKMIYLDRLSEEVVIKWNGKGFKKMTNLKTLIIKKANFSKGCKFFPSGLRVLEWKKYPSTPFSIMTKKFENMKVLKFDKCKYITKISNVSCLPNLEEFSFEYCKNLITIDNSIGFLSKLEFLNAEGCTKLRSFPPLKLPSLKDLTLSNCKSLQNFPEILDKIEGLEEIDIVGTSIQEIPVSFQNLIGLSTVTIETCEKLMFPSCSICSMPNVDIVKLTSSNLSLCLPMVIKWLANMSWLNLSGSDFRVLPECLKECTSLHTLELDDCHSLEVIYGIPPNLQRLSASNCKSLNSSSKSMLLNKKLHQSRETEFLFPSAEGEMIPEWFNHQSRGTTFPFWFRNKFPFIIIFLSTHFDDLSPELSFNLCINDFERNVAVPYYLWVPPSHTYIYNLGMQQLIDKHGCHLCGLSAYVIQIPPSHQVISGPKLMPKVDEAFEKNEWIYAEIKFQYADTFHLYFKEENNVDNIRFTNPPDNVDNIRFTIPATYEKAKIVERGRFRYRTC